MSTEYQMSDDQFHDEEDADEDESDVNEEDDDEFDSDDEDNAAKYRADLFGFVSSDRQYILELMHGVRVLIGRESTTPKQLLGLAKLLFALGRLPRPTNGIDLYLSLGQKFKNGESRHMVLKLSEIAFELETAAFEIRGNYGGDSSCSFPVQVEVGGFRHAEGPMAFAYWVSSFVEWAEDPAEVLTLEDGKANAAIDWDATGSDNDWDQVEDGDEDEDEDELTNLWAGFVQYHQLTENLKGRDSANDSQPTSDGG